MEDKRYIPSNVGTQTILMAELPKRKRRVLVQCSCGGTRWMYWFVLKKTPSSRCKICAYKERRIIPRRFKQGDRIGKAAIEEVLCGFPGGQHYRVRFDGCGHERTVVDTPRQRFKGTLCRTCVIGRCRNGYGYVDWYWAMPEGNRVTVKEHRIVMEGVIGREMFPNEEVHHVNGIRDDNRPDNLELWSSSQPPGQRVSDKVEWAKALLALYEPEALRER